MARYDAPIEEYGLSSLDAVLETASGYLPSKSEFKNILIAGGGAAAAFIVADHGSKFLSNLIPIQNQKLKDWLFIGLKVLAAAAGGKMLYRYNTEAGTGFAVGMMLSALKDVAVATGAGKFLPLPAAVEASAATAGYGSDDMLLGTGQVDIEEHSRLAQVDVEEQDHLVGFYGYTPDQTSYVAQ